MRNAVVFHGLLLLLVPWTAVCAQEPAAGLPMGRPEQLGLDAEVLSKFTDQLEEEAGRGHLAGGSALVARRGQAAFVTAVGFADREAGRAMSPSTIVRIASMTKPITSVAVMILVDEGKLSVEDPLSKYLPEFREARVAVEGSEEPVPARREITIHDLLTHTSGIVYRFSGHPQVGPLYVRAGVTDGLSEIPGTQADNAWRLAQLPLAHEPGEAWSYGLNTDVLGRVVEVVSGKTLNAFFEERIFKPLRMVDTHFHLPRNKRNRLAAVYAFKADGPVARLEARPQQEGALVYSPGYPLWEDSQYHSGGAGLVSTLGDYARFLQMLLNEGELDGIRVLKPETVRAMTTNQVGELPTPDWGHGDRFGYGFGVETRPREAGRAAPGSYSWGGFFYTDFWVDPENDLIAVMFTQTYPSGDLKLREMLRTVVYEGLAD